MPYLQHQAPMAHYPTCSQLATLLISISESVLAEGGPPHNQCSRDAGQAAAPGECGRKVHQPRGQVHPFGHLQARGDSWPLLQRDSQPAKGAACEPTRSAVIALPEPAL